MIDPLKVLVCTVAPDGRVETGYTWGMVAASACHMFGNVLFTDGRQAVGIPDARLLRNLSADIFLKSKCDWMLSIDPDICFSANDVRTLMDYPPADEKGTPYVEENTSNTTVNSDGEALIVCAEYSRKTEALDACRFGLGFCRIHRSVFEKLMAADADDGTPRVGQFLSKIGLIYDFFPNGPGLDNTWFTEAAGFFHVCRLCGITPRIETGCRLANMGSKAYPYPAYLARPFKATDAP